MVYNWDGKQEDCYRLYVEERKSLDEVIEFWKQRGFTPSKRAFQTQFKRWDFPSKQNPAHRNDALVARVEQLWKANVMQRDMLETLLTEGFQINDRELMRLRLRFKWLLRESSATKKKDEGERAPEELDVAKRRRLLTDGGSIDQLADALLQEEGLNDGDSDDERADVEHGADTQPQALADPQTAVLDPEEALRRRARLQQLQAESEEKWKTRKRRRRTRGYQGLPPDTPGEPPRFPSETTLDESKAYLELDNTMYREIRDRFQAICEGHGVLRKTVAGPDKWPRVKEQLIRDIPHLSAIFQQDAEARQQNTKLSTPSNLKALSLDVICMDVTKRMRNSENRMCIPEAKNALGLNPEETRQVRSAFYAKLKAEHVSNKFELGDARWNQLKQEWVQESALLMRVLEGADEADQSRAEKTKAIDVLARDVMKRLRSDNVKTDPSRKKQIYLGPGPGPAPPTGPSHASHAHLKQLPRSANSAAIQTGIVTPTSASVPDIADLQIDPSLLLAASDPSILPHPAEFNTDPLPIYFRLHPLSSASIPGKNIWLSILQSRTVAHLKMLAMKEHPFTSVVKIEGLVAQRLQGHPDRELALPIDDDDELTAYLEHVAGGKATFVVLLGPAQDSAGRG